MTKNQKQFKKELIDLLIKEIKAKDFKVLCFFSSISYYKEIEKLKIEFSEDSERINDITSLVINFVEDFVINHNLGDLVEYNIESNFETYIFNFGIDR